MICSIRLVWACCIRHAANACVGVIDRYVLQRVLFVKP
jgi:hypothetical protein